MPFVVMVAGPNGSGKTTLTRYLRDQQIELGRYINADDIALDLKGDYEDRVRAAQIIADQQRLDSLERRIDFTFETVMSHPSKVEFFEDCLAAGYNAILYFVATRDPRLNVARVAQRVQLGGHDVPTERIIQRYHRSLELLPRALSCATTAALFDNSDQRGLLLGTTKSNFPSYRTPKGAPEWMYAAVKQTLEFDNRGLRGDGPGRRRE
jgi:predicted ABC-type ATPase